MKSRVSRFKYGVQISVPYDPYDPQHAERSSQAEYLADGIKCLPNAFSTILDEVSRTGLPGLISSDLTGVFQGVRVSETQEFRSAFCYFSRWRESLDEINDTIKAYRGSSRNPRWVDSEPGECFNHRPKFNYLMLALRRLLLQSLYGICRHLKGPETEDHKPPGEPL